MIGNPLAQRLCYSGLALFVFGLGLGFAIKALPNPRLALSAHLNAVQSGTFLIVLGLAWTQLAVWPRAAGPLADATWLSIWGLEIGMVLAAFVAADAAPGGGLRIAAQAFQGVSAVVMFVAVGALLIPFGRR
jgi:hydroxylaminobenzene mutase